MLLGINMLKKFLFFGGIKITIAKLAFEFPFSI
jgi:hypothetical protein